jgi:hypothetical protein
MRDEIRFQDFGYQILCHKAYKEALNEAKLHQSLFSIFSETSLNRPALGPKKYGRFRGVAGFLRLPLQRIVRQGLKNSADIQGGPVF